MAFGGGNGRIWTSENVLESLGPALSHGGIFGTQSGHLRGKMTPTRFWGSGGVSRGGSRRLEIGFRGPVMADWDI